MRLAQLLTTAVACTLTLGALSSIAHAQAWIRPAGEIYVNTSFTNLTGDQFYAPDKSVQDIASTYTQSSVNLYAEAGLIDKRLQLTFSGEVFRRNELEGQGATEGTGDLQAGLWVGLLQDGPIKLSAGLVVGLPTGDERPDAEGDDPVADDIARLLPTGDGEVDYEPRIIAGYGFGGGPWPLRHYVVGELGYAIRGEGIDDGIRYRLELGSQIARPGWDRFWLLTRLHGLESFASDEEAGRGFSGLGQGVTHTSVGAELYGRVVDSFGISVGTDVPVRARNIIAGLPVRASLSYTF
ncbi:MAG: hypothetical protein ACE366_19510 [Bradymonadia bacterium]